MLKFVFGIGFSFILLVACHSPRLKAESPDMEELIKMADEYYSARNYDKCIVLLNEIIEQDSTYGKAFFQRGYCQSLSFSNTITLENNLKSITDYLKSIELNYRVEDSYFNIGCIYAGNGNDTVALKYFLKVCEINPENTDAQTEVLIIKSRLGITEI